MPDSSKKQRLKSVALLKEQGQWFYLLHALILLLLLYPFFETPAETKTPLAIAFLHSLVILAIIYTTSGSWQRLVFGLALGIPTLTFFWLHQGEAYPLARMCFLALMYAYSILVITYRLIYLKEVSFDEVYAAASMYILIGLLWALLYQIVELLVPGSFYIGEVHNIDQVLNWSDFIYYSFTTLTTLGYGDISPVTAHARSLAILEAITGVIFISVMIAKTMGLYLSNVIVKQSEKIEKDIEMGIEKELENLPLKENEK